MWPIIMLRLITPRYCYQKKLTLKLIALPMAIIYYINQSMTSLANSCLTQPRKAIVMFVTALAFLDSLQLSEPTGVYFTKIESLDFNFKSPDLAPLHRPPILALT